MRKVNYLVGSLALGLGVIVGTLGVSLFTNSNSPASFIAKLRGQDNIQTVAGAVQAPGQSNPVGNTATDGLAENSSALNSGGQANDSLSLANNGENKDTAALNGQTSSNTIISPQVVQKIITDYKQDIGIFFDAWKSPDMATFRLKLARAYTGELLEKHARRAEEYLVQGVGLDVSQIIFDRVDVENADANTATIRVNYHYTARDYSLADAATVGEAHEQNVQVRVNLLNQNSRWMITGESTVQ